MRPIFPLGTQGLAQALSLLGGQPTGGLAAIGGDAGQLPVGGDDVVEPAALAAIAEEPLAAKSFHFAFSAADVTYLCHQSEGSWIEREAKEWDYPIIYIEESEIGTLKKIQQFSMGFPLPAESDACAAALNARLGDKIHAYPNACSLDITPVGVGKDQGIRTLLSVMGWDGAEVFAIGDETNDLPMLKAFDGYTLTTAREAIQKQAKEVFPSVGAMMNHYL